MMHDEGQQHGMQKTTSDGHLTGHKCTWILFNIAIIAGCREDTLGALSEFDLRIREGKHSGFNDCPSPEDLA